MMSTHVQFGFGSGWPGAENPWHSYSQCYCLAIGSIGVWNLEEEHNPVVDHYFPGWRWLFKGIVHVQTPTHVGSSGSGGSRSLDPAIRVSRKCRCSWHLWWILGGSSQESVQWVNSPQNWTLPLFTIYPTERTGVITRLLAEMILPLSKKTDPAVPSSDPKLLWVKKGETEFFTEDHAVCVWVFLVKNKQHKSSKECVWKWRIPPNNSNNPKYVFFQCANGKLMINHGGLGASFSTETIPATEVGRWLLLSGIHLALAVHIFLSDV